MVATDEKKLVYRAAGVEISLDDVYAAREMIGGRAKRTPVFTNTTISSLAERELSFKMEVFQKTGSFKIRGALNAIFSLTDDQAAKGVVTHSSGNHAQATALAAKLRGIPAYIVVPENAPKVKVAAIESYDGKITFCGLTMKDRETACDKIREEKGCHFVAPFNAKETICGQATIGCVLTSPPSPPPPTDQSTDLPRTDDALLRRSSTDALTLSLSLSVFFVPKGLN